MITNVLQVGQVTHPGRAGSGRIGSQARSRRITARPGWTLAIVFEGWVVPLPAQASSWRV